MAAADESAQTILEMKAMINSLNRDKRVLCRKLEKMELSEGKKEKKMAIEQEMRLNANKERFALQQKLTKLQKSISARLNLLQIDFSQADNLTNALDLCFGAITKLIKEIESKENELKKTKTKISKNKKLQKQINELLIANQQMNEENISIKMDLDAIKHQNDKLINDKTEIESKWNEAKKSVMTIQSELETMNNERNEFEKDKNKINALQQQIATKNELIQKQQNDINAMQKNLDFIEFRQNKKISEMELLQKNVKEMHAMLRSKDGQIKMLKNKINSIQNTNK